MGVFWLKRIDLKICGWGLEIEHEFTSKIFFMPKVRSK